MSRPVIGSAYQPRSSELRTATHYSALRPRMDDDAARLQRALLADAGRRARSMRSTNSDDMRRAKAHRICFDLLRVLRGG
jgi:hypothetical protein